METFSAISSHVQNRLLPGSQPLSASEPPSLDSESASRPSCTSHPLSDCSDPRKTPYQLWMALAYGIVNEFSSSGTCTARLCNFCITFGQEVKSLEQQKRERTKRAQGRGSASALALAALSKGRKYRNPPLTIRNWGTGDLRLDTIQHHLWSQHPSAYKEYLGLDDEDKMAYFKKRSISAVTVANLSSRSGKHTIHISASIIDIIIMKLFLEGGASGATKARVKGLFSPVIDDGSSAFMPSYTVTIANITDFKTSLLGASLGMTFRATAKFANGQSTIQGRRGCYHLSPGTVTKYVRTTVAVVMEVIWSLLANPSVWAFSLAFDSTTHDGHSYFDMRIRLQIAGRLLNIRVAALPVYGSHKANDFMPILTSLLGALCPDWKEKLIGISTDGKRSMVGHKGGIVTQLIRLAAPQIVYRMWCLIHQLDIFTKRALDELYDGCFVKLMNKLTHDLRKNLTFISGPSDDGTRNGLCLMQSTRWLAMGKRCKWLLGHRYTIIDFIALQTRAGAKTAVDLPEWFWPIVGVVNSYIRGFELALKQLQEANIVLSQQDLIVIELTERLWCNTHAMKTTDTVVIVDCADDDNGIDWNDISGDSNSTRVDDGNGNSIGSGDRDVVSSGTWSVSINHVAQYIRDCGSSINADFDRLSALHRDRLIRQTGRFITSILTGVSGVCALRDPNNEMSREQLPPIFPRQLVKMSGVEFATKYKPFLKRFGDLRGKDMAGQAELAHAEMVAAFKERGLAQTVISLQTDKTPFNKAWEQLGCDYPLLCDFVGGIATIFANSGTVESDFSKLNRIANPHRRSLTDLSLEGSLQAEYYEEMFKLGGIVL